MEIKCPVCDSKLIYEEFKDSYIHLVIGNGNAVTITKEREQIDYDIKCSGNDQHIIDDDIQEEVLEIVETFYNRDIGC